MKYLLSFSVMLFGAALAVPVNDVDTFSIENRITGGMVATPNQFPYQVGMEMEKIRNGETVYTWCGGSLISDQVILTAAHCLKQAVSAIVMLGAHNRYEAEEPGRIMIEVFEKDMIVHEKYSKVSSENDIALIILPKKVTLTSKIQTINLPHRSQISENFAKTMGIISGWGRRGDGPDDSGTRELRYVPRMIVPDELCKHAFPLYKGRSQICVDGSEQKSACTGDSGGPLAIDGVDGSKTLVGLTSYGRRGCQKNFPVAYTRITAYLDWIASKTGIKIKE